MNAEGSDQLAPPPACTTTKMSHDVRETRVCEALLDFVLDGTYPESDDLITSQLNLSALSKELQLISTARKQVEEEISSLSQENALDAEGWISKARELHADIERSRVTARQIVAQHEKTKVLQSKVKDAAAKVSLLETEIAFNQTVTSSLEEVQRLVNQLEAGRTGLRHGSVISAINTLEQLEKDLGAKNLLMNTNALDILSDAGALFRRELAEFTQARWREQVHIDRKGECTITKDRESLGDTIAALTRLDVLPFTADSFQIDLLSAVISPILLPNMDGYTRAVSTGESGIRVDPKPSMASVSNVLDCVSRVLGYLRKNIPEPILTSLSETFIQSISSKLVSCWLSPSIPADLGGFAKFEMTLDSVLQFVDFMDTLGWHNFDGLRSWVGQVPRLWLIRRRVDSLDRVRKVLAASQGTTKEVERIEKEAVSRADKALLDNATSDDWDAAWDEVTDDHAEERLGTNHEQDEHVSVWGLDEDLAEVEKVTSQPDAPVNPDEDDDGGDTWGWGEEEEDQSKHLPSASSATISNFKDRNHTVSRAAESEVILRETYTVTDVPDSILQIVQQQILDSEALSQPEYSNSRVTSSGSGLLALPTLILAMFKATAPSFYTNKPKAGNMFLYNDSLYLATQIRDLAEPRQLTRLNADIDTLEKFGKMGYSKELLTQRTIIIDLLDGAQGFNECSEQPFLSQCENAINATVSRIRVVYDEWRSILSPSALLQSIGSLLSTAIDKVIIDIEDLGDISESQSQRLVQFCSQVSELEDLFRPDTKADSEAMPTTAVYVRNWLKFQYFINILESSLADIKFLWTEGELRLEFTPDEVVGLIEALFAESDHRRRTIAEIRRS